MRMLVRTIAAMGLVSLAACGTGPLQSTAPALSIDKAPVDFGSQPVLSPVQRKIHFTNVGRANLTWNASIDGFDAGPLDGGSFDPDGGLGDSSVFQLAYEPADAGSPLAAGDSVDAVITFNAPVQGSYSANFVMTTNDRQNPMVSIPITAQATTAAAIVAKPMCLNFGAVPAGQSAVQQLTITSTGTAPLAIGQMTISGESAAAFQVLGSTAGTGNNPIPPTPGSNSITLNVMFQPQTTFPNTNNMYTADLKFPTNDPSNRIVDVCLQGQLEQLPVAVINVTAPNSGQTMVPPGTMLTLSDAMSTAPAGQSLTNFHWDLANVPMGSNAKACPDSPTAGTCMLNVDQPGEFDVELTVTDTAGQTGRTLQKIIGATSQAIQVELTWDTAQGDLDLHYYPVIKLDGGGAAPNTGFGSICDCNGSNPNPSDLSCLYGNTDPMSTGDKLSGFGPEDVTYDTPANGNYQVTVEYISAQGVSNLMPTATVRFYLFGSVRSVFTKQMTTPGEQWNVAWINWPSETVTPGNAP